MSFFGHRFGFVAGNIINSMGCMGYGGGWEGGYAPCPPRCYEPPPCYGYARPYAPAFAGGYGPPAYQPAYAPYGGSPFGGLAGIGDAVGGLVGNIFGGGHCFGGWHGWGGHYAGPCEFEGVAPGTWLSSNSVRQARNGVPWNTP